MQSKISDRKIRVGVVGLTRGISFVRTAKNVGMELVAICDISEERLKEVGTEYNVATYTEYNEFLGHDMDAVVLANYFDEHAPFAIKALESGKHVLSETSCNSTIAEGVELCRAVEKSGLIYMLAENCAYTKFNQEMKRLYDLGEVGEVIYAEGEYNHPSSKQKKMQLAPTENHWRNWMPSVYYCTHALAPLMYITDRMPVKVHAVSIPCKHITEGTFRKGDPGSVILCRMDNGSVFKIFGISIPGHSLWYRLHGEKGAMETIRGPGHFGPGHIRVWHEEWDLEPEQVREKVYVPNWPVDDTNNNILQDITQAGHSGADFWTNYYFAEAIRKGKQPYLDVYRGVTMSTVGILAWKSALNDGCPFKMPDFYSESERRKHENDRWSPFPKDAGKGQPPSSITLKEGWGK